MADLLSLDRALAQLPNVGESDYPVVAALVSACSGVIETHCNRTFAQATYDELYHGTGTPYLFVDNPPIRQVVAVRTSPLPAIFIQYADPQNQTQVANVGVTSTAVVLTKLYNGTTTTNTFTFTAYPTFTALAAGINAVSGWSATVPSQFALWATNDLAVQAPGTFSARNMSVPLTVYWYGLSQFRYNAELGELYTPGGWVPGYQNYRVTYTGGYADIPEEVQQACAELVQLTYASRNANPLMQSETLDKYSYTRAATNSFDLLSATSKMALAQYKVHRVARYK